MLSKKSVVFGLIMVFLVFSFIDLVLAIPSVSDEFNLKVIPEQPKPYETITLKITNKTGDTIKRMRITVYNPKHETVFSGFISEGILTLSSLDTKSVGVYKIGIEDYAGFLNFSVKNELWYAGPNPSMPVVGEKITLGVPQGVGVKIYDSKGELYLACKTLLDVLGKGVVEFTIDTPGIYELRIAEISVDYWQKNLSLRVYERKKFDIEITPENPKIEEILTIKISSEANAVENAEVEITYPSGKIEKKITEKEGKVTAVPTEIGEYLLKVRKDKFETAEKRFSAYDSFRVKVIPEEISTEDIITIKVRDNKNRPVTDAEFSISNLITETTDIDGELRFQISNPGNYKFKIEKFGFWTLEDSLVVLPLSTLNLPEVVEVGMPIKIETLNLAKEKISSTKTILKPSGVFESITSDEYVPNEIGTYYVNAKNPSYKSINGSFKVISRPIDVRNEISGRNIRIFTSSHSVPVSGIVIFVETPKDEKTFVTNDNGTVEFEVEEGEFKIYANLNRRNLFYEEKIIHGFVRKQYSLVALLIPIFVIILLATIAILKPWKKEKALMRLFIQEKEGTSLGRVGKFKAKEEKVKGTTKTIIEKEPTKEEKSKKEEPKKEEVKSETQTPLSSV
ncbi:MAG: hypothetical protein QXY62_04170 [Candidatus Altiarchaeota archaeon]